MELEKAIKNTKKAIQEAESAEDTANKVMSLNKLLSNSFTLKGASLTTLERLNLWGVLLQTKKETKINDKIKSSSLDEFYKNTGITFGVNNYSAPNYFSKTYTSTPLILPENVLCVVYDFESRAYQRVVNKVHVSLYDHKRDKFFLRPRFNLYLSNLEQPSLEQRLKILPAWSKFMAQTTKEHVGKRNKNINALYAIEHIDNLKTEQFCEKS